MAMKIDVAEEAGKAEEIKKKDEDEEIDVLKIIDYEEKKFGFCRVSWVIKNYCAIPFNRDKLFYSPEFYVRGFHLTKWRMIVTKSYLSRKSSPVKFRLERLPCEPYTGDVLVDCCLEYNDHHGETIEFEFNKTFGVHIMNTENLRLFNAGVTPVNNPHSDNFLIKLEILVLFTGISETVPTCANEGIRRLSEDFFNLYEDGIITDMKLGFQNHRLDVHKAILLHRLTSEKFQEKITPDAELILLDDFMAEPAEKVIRFFYTGNLHYAVGVTEPAVAVFRFAELLDVEPIVAYYNPEEVELNSDIEVEEYSTKWIIEDFINRDDNFLESPVMINSTMDTKWRLRVYPKGVGRDGEYVHIYLKYETKTCKDICAKLFLGKDDAVISHTYHRKICPDGILNGIDLVTRDNVINNYMTGDSLTIGLRLRMSMDEENITVGKSISGYKYISEQKIYERFSQDILSIYENERFANMRLDFNDHNIIICAHEYILHVRCTYLLFTLRKPDMAFFRTINHAVIFALFFFVYSGKIKGNLSLEDTFSLYGTAAHFNFNNLKQVIAENLLASLSETNADNILEFASRQNIRNLENSAREILEGNGQEN